MSDDIVVVTEPPTTVIVNDIVTTLEIGTLNTNTIVDNAPDTVVANQVGVQGPPGPPGPAGLYYLHTQSTPSTSWPIPHNLGKYPNISVIIGGVVSGTRVEHVDVNNSIATSNVAVAGLAVCS